MKRQRLTEAIAAEVRAMGLHGRVRMPQETRRRIREQVLKAIFAEREADKKRETALAAGREPEDTFTWQPQRRR